MTNIQIEQEILEIIEISQTVTHSDLQGIVGALALKIKREEN